MGQILHFWPALPLSGSAIQNGLIESTGQNFRATFLDTQDVDELRMTLFKKSKRTPLLCNIILIRGEPQVLCKREIRLPICFIFIITSKLATLNLLNGKDELEFRHLSLGGPIFAQTADSSK
jgi:hypothetical protein